MQAASTVWTSKVRLVAIKWQLNQMIWILTQLPLWRTATLFHRRNFDKSFFSSEHQLTLTVIFDTDSGLISLNKTITKGITLKCEICEFSPAKQTCYTVHLIIKVHDVNVAESARNLLPNNIYTAGDIRMWKAYKHGNRAHLKTDTWSNLVLLSIQYY